MRCLVEGRVQGVFFRACTAREAKRLGLDGHARNLSDGRVEVVAQGSPDAIADLCQWLWKGSPGSRVTAVTVADHPDGVPTGFRTA